MLGLFPPPLWGRVRERGRGHAACKDQRSVSAAVREALRRRTHDARRRLCCGDYLKRRTTWTALGFRRQAPIGNFIADFVCHSARSGCRDRWREPRFRDRVKTRDARTRCVVLRSQGYRGAALHQRAGDEEFEWRCGSHSQTAMPRLPGPPSLTLPHKGGGNRPARADGSLPRKRGRGASGERAVKRHDEIHPRVAQGASRHRSFARRDRRQAHHDRARGRARRGQGGAAGALCHRARRRGEAASECRPAAGVHGGYRRRAIRCRSCAARRMRARA